MAHLRYTLLCRVSTSRKGGVTGIAANRRRRREMRRHLPPPPNLLLPKIGKIFFGQIACKIRAFS